MRQLMIPAFVVILLVVVGCDGDGSASNDPVAPTSSTGAPTSSLAAPNTLAPPTTEAAPGEGVVAPDVVLLPVPPRAVNSSDEAEYFVFRQVSGAESFVATTRDETSDDGTTIVESFAELRIDGPTQQLTNGDTVRNQSWLIAEEGVWVREDEGAWTQGQVDSSLGFIVAGVSPDELYPSLFDVFERLRFVGWEDRNGAATARYEGEEEAALELLGLREVADVAASSLVVYLDPAGYFQGFDVRIEVESGAYRALSWSVTDLNTTSIEIPG